MQLLPYCYNGKDLAALHGSWCNYYQDVYGSWTMHVQGRRKRVRGDGLDKRIPQGPLGYN